MAIVKIKPIKTRIDNALNYITNEEKTFNKEYELENEDIYLALKYIENENKTNDKLFVTGINCKPETAFEEMQKIKQKYNKLGGNLAYHVIHSYKPGELTPNEAHEIGVEFANEMFGDRFQVVVSTHLDKGHLHNHIVLNSVSFKDGLKYYDTRESYALLRHVSNKICEEHDLSFFEEKKCKQVNYKNYYNKYINRELNDIQKSVKEDLDSAISVSFTFDDFKNNLKRLNYDFYIRNGRMTLKDKFSNKEFKIQRLFGDDYTIKSIKDKIYEPIESKNIKIKYKYKIGLSKDYAKYHNHRYKKVKYKTGDLIIAILRIIFLGRQVYTARVNQYKLTPKLRAEIKKMNEYSKQAITLSKYKINTLEELYTIKNNKENEIYTLIRKREKIYKHKKNYSTEEYNFTTTDLNTQIHAFREDLRILNTLTEKCIKQKEMLEEYDKMNEERQRELDKQIRIYRIQKLLQN